MSANRDYLTPELRNWLIAASFGDGLQQDSADAHSNGDGTSAPLPEVFEAPVVPLRETVVYPRAVMPLSIARERSLRAVESAGEMGLVATIAQKNIDAPDPRPSDLYATGTACKLGRSLRMPDGTTSLLVRGQSRVRVIDWLQATPFMVARVQVIREQPAKPPSTEALMRAVMSLFERVIKLDRSLPEESFVYAMNVGDPGWLADLIAQTIPLEIAQRQTILEAVEPSVRLQKLSVMLARELDVLELEDRIQLQVQNEVDKSQREIFLREQIRAIQSELGEDEAWSPELSALRERLNAKALPTHVRAKADEELARLSHMDGFSPEISMVRTYIDWLLDLPWVEQTEDRLDVKLAEKILNERHYGLPKVKERILEHIAVRMLAGEKMRTPIICFVGPPGTGKTSMARSIADSLGRKFVRMSVGGVHDEAEIRGHRRTYIGALPGRILQTMKRAGTINPLFVLDEIDKLGDMYGFRGDPSAALLEVLDPEQNHEFEDHYLDLSYDLSKVMWVTTANVLDTVPPALDDRMEVIEFPGYVEEEKLEIARQFLVPRQIEENGLSKQPVVFGADALRHIVREYTYEAGVRNLEREIATICRKVARKLAENQPIPRRLTPAMLHKYLGPPEFDFGMLDEKDQVGVANGVAWSEAGGDLMPIEVTLVEGKGSLMLTGQLGDVMQESAQAALSYTRSISARIGVKPHQYEKSDIHVHVAEGAVPKEGPSAGITIATALISALTKTPVRRDVAMTGEITLRGRVLPIGGLKEKLLAAHRIGIRTFIMPKKNAKDLEEVPKKIQRDMQLVQVSTMEEVLAAAMARTVWKVKRQHSNVRKQTSRYKHRKSSVQNPALRIKRQNPGDA
ncbi:MAG: endopeptidase La [Chloroflexi bacterium]|nr:endopeptidase La [Chloroflexota bacterium]MCL5274416.1 endopeptidase La [Chloroflexota bacterium]